MKRAIPEFILAASAALFGVSVGIAQTAPPASPPDLSFANPPHKNLKFLPQDITGPQLLGTMKLFTVSLGVRCTYCHVGEEGKPLSTFDFASDAKDHKLTARKMLAMMHRINAEDFDVKQFKDTKVTCFTCHRGSTQPVAFPPAVPRPSGAPPSSPPSSAG
ncbi:MAG TPA: c-type cytochrome [Sphingomicrobium sp.]|nr:c-type cytochrome [Sphingomicrobium sp.]